eukprot:335054_1
MGSAIRSPRNDAYNTLLSQTKDIPTLQEGYLQKQSAHIQKYRKRWVVLKNERLILSYKTKKKKELTEIFDLLKYNSIEENEHMSSTKFRLISATETRSFKAETNPEMLEWIKNIKTVQKKYRPTQLPSPAVNISKDNNEYGIDSTEYNKSRTSVIHKINDCISLDRILEIMTYYRKYSNRNINDSDNEFFTKHLLGRKGQIINDYHHILDHHLNEE